MKVNDFLMSTDLKLSTTFEYVDGYKYQSRSDFVWYVGYQHTNNIVTDLVVYRTDGWILVKKYFAWDGCSGPTWDDSTNARACLVHDAGYYLMREGFLPFEARDYFDKVLANLIFEDSRGKFLLGLLGGIRAKIYRFCVRHFAANAARSCSKRKLKTSP